MDNIDFEYLWKPIYRAMPTYDATCPGTLRRAFDSCVFYCDSTAGKTVTYLKEIWCDAKGRYWDCILVQTLDYTRHIRTDHRCYFRPMYWVEEA